VASAPEHAATLGEVLAAHVRAHPDRTHVHLWQSEQVEEALSYGALDGAARTLAQGLVAAGIERGDRVAIMLPTSLGFFQAFFGAILAGAVPVPVYPPLRRAQIEDHLRRQAGILRNAEAAVLITDEATRRFGTLLSGLVASLRGVHTVAGLMASGTRLERPPTRQPRTRR
jgi:acyl-CoA synthetase (AMP-forming)/AMP-acid ligase II